MFMAEAALDNPVPFQNTMMTKANAIAVIYTLYMHLRLFKVFTTLIK